MSEDIRDKLSIDHEDVIRLNFIRADGPYVFRRYYRNGLRSHVMAVLLADDVTAETKGVIIGGVRWFPKACPVKMLRVFRRRFEQIDAVFAEIKRVKFIETFLTHRYMARSDEFIARYGRTGKGDFILCGLQEYVFGTELNPWHPFRLRDLPEILTSLAMGSQCHFPPDLGDILNVVQGSADRFIHGIKTMIRESGHIPDLAGEGNMLLTPSGDIKLVDINNISKVGFTPEVYLDDIGYPVCDKSIEALSLIEGHLLNRAPDMGDPVYEFYLAPDRMARVRDLDKAFHQSINQRHHDGVDGISTCIGNR
jgi:hypothetical protein